MSPFLTYRFLGYFLSKINFDSIQRRLNDDWARIVLLEYTQSRSDSVVYMSEKIPNTSYCIHDVLTPEFLNELTKIIQIPGSTLYTRRKIVDGDLSNVRQLVMKFDSCWDMPGLVDVSSISHA